MANQPVRRELVRNAFGALGSLLLFSKLQACQRERAAAGGPTPAVGAAGASPSRDEAGPARAANGGSTGAQDNPPTASPNAMEPASPLAGRSGAAVARGDEDASTPAREQPALADTRVACAAVTSFPKIVDDAPRATFTRMDQGDQLQWLGLGVSATLYAAQLPDCVLFMLGALDRIHAGYPISVLAHSLQAATRARRANASDEMVLCALCHHLGMILTFEGQAELSAAILRGFVSEDAYRVVRHQNEYQWAHYGDALGLPTGLRDRYASESWHTQAVQFCDEWDSPSYDPSYDALPLAELAPLVRAKLGTESGYLVGQQTSSDCIAGGV